MAQMRLSQKEIKKRLIKLRNLERLHAEQKARNERLTTENKRISVLETTILAQQKTIEDLKLQIEELRTMVFGRKKQKPIDDDDLLPPKEKVERTSDSYKRPIPKDAEVTETKIHPMNKCNQCHSRTTKKKIVLFYEEDIPMPTQKIVRKHIVEKSYCHLCRKWNTGISLPAHQVMLGINVQKYVCYLSVVCRLSFTQIQNILQDTCQIHISQGEIVKILNREAIKLRPFYEQLKVKIRGEPGIHLDETAWKQLCDGSNTFSWVMSGTESKENVFLVGESRGGGNVEKLIGEDFKGFVVSDDYGAYRKLKKHQLCWAHPIRKFRDIAYSKELSDEQRIHCKRQYEVFSEIYYDLEKNRNPEHYRYFSQRLERFSAINSNDPMKMRRLKMTLRKNIPKYLTCLSNPRIPLTNNQAERSLRHLVLKRKISFGSLTKRTAENLAVLMSSLPTLKQRFQNNFFGEYLRV